MARARLVLLATDPELESELKALSGQIESHKFFSTAVYMCPTAERIDDLDRAVTDCMNGASVALVPLVGESFGVGMRALAVLRTPVILLADSDGYHAYREHKIMVCTEVIMTILTGSSSHHTHNVPKSGVVRVGNPLPWIPQVHLAVAQEVVAAVRQQPLSRAPAAVLKAV